MIEMDAEAAAQPPPLPSPSLSSPLPFLFLSSPSPPPLPPSGPWIREASLYVKFSNSPLQVLQESKTVSRVFHHSFREEPIMRRTHMATLAPLLLALIVADQARYDAKGAVVGGAGELTRQTIGLRMLQPLDGEVVHTSLSQYL